MRMKMRAIFYREFFEGNSRKFSKFESKNEGNIFESFGIPRPKVSMSMLILSKPRAEIVTISGSISNPVLCVLS